METKNIEQKNWLNYQNRLEYPIEKKKDIEAFFVADILGFIALVYSLWVLPIECSMDELISGMAIILYIVISVFVYIYLQNN